jgi:hypothetical protein
MSFMWPGNLKQDEKSYLAGSQVSLRVLTQKESPAYVMMFRALGVSAKCCLVFASILAAWMVQWWWLSIIMAIPAFLMLLWLTMVILVFVATVLVGHFQKKRCYNKPLLFWAWLPCLTLSLCLFCGLLAFFFGRYIWESSLSPYHQLGHLQAYRGIDTDIALGSQLMDAGLVDFVPFTQIDRSRGGCFVGAGNTYCVSPILKGGQLHASGTGGSPRAGSYDYFAVGINCCVCPNIDFRCGEWNNPQAVGGIRSLDYAARPFFRLAVEDWSASYNKVSNHPLFFEWTENPRATWSKMFEWSTAIAMISVVVLFPLVFTVALGMGKVLQFLIHHEYASPLNTPYPAAGTEKAWAWFLPDMLYFAEEERRQLLGLPEEPAPWYPRSEHGATHASRAMPESGVAAHSHDDGPSPPGMMHHPSQPGAFSVRLPGTPGALGGPLIPGAVPHGSPVPAGGYGAAFPMPGRPA